VFNVLFDIVTSVLAVIAIIVSVLSYRQSGSVHQWEVAEAVRRAVWEKEQAQLQLVASQPRVIAVGADFGVEGTSIPQWLTDKDHQTLWLVNAGNSTATEVYGVLFRATTFYPETNRPINLPFAYWDGELDTPLAVGAEKASEKALITYQKAYPLRGDESVIPTYTLCPQNTAEFGTPGHHWYFARLTLTYRDAHNRTLASIFDWESVVVNNSLTQTPVLVKGPVEVQRDLRYFEDQATKQRQAPVFRAGMTDVSEP
jgi:hypothetical protein